ncbi:high frequency lysogenization protein HflD [Granulosicoccus antarcticus]|uniref:High frequency lysogenization protein HflD homolog n=1 Tax=Granulosicoccus antarcticus IMCC3135 TaxID=1192854 RepID=A0A2Z2NU24_9GAMM|nr:high frequency lysogenization protein HflD [Granulosicoccus antarcticus]ASJ74986.1 High frequency lysogenization protein HflD [Granulosicoccus antarcticus IMCC3135]
MTSLATTENQTLALAGIFQSVHLCKTLATTGTADKDELAGTLRSILTLSSDRVIDAYGGSAQNIATGLRILKSQLGGNNESRDLDIARYALALIQLGTNILHDEDTVEQLRIGISRTQSMDMEIDDSAMISNLANLYRSSISHLSPRIMVSGDPDFLNDNEVASTIRAALLGGIRSVVLWRQCGGSRPKLLFSRTQYLKEADLRLQRL